MEYLNVKWDQEKDEKIKGLTDQLRDMTDAVSALLLDAEGTTRNRYIVPGAPLLRLRDIIRDQKQPR